MTKTVKPDTKLTEALLQELLECASHIQRNPAKFTAAFTDMDTRQEFKKLCDDLYSLVEVIEEESK